MTDKARARKLEFTDYQKIRMMYENAYTIRAIAGTFSISTKYVRRLLDKPLLEIASGAVVWDKPIEADYQHRCSGCNRPFEQTSQLESHYSSYLSGGMLGCMELVPGR